MSVPEKGSEGGRRHTWFELLVGFMGLLLGVLLFHVLPRVKRLPLRLLPREKRIQRLLADIDGGEEWSRILAMEDLGRLKEPRAIPLLVAALDDSDDRDCAIDALVMIGQESVPYLLESAKSAGELGRQSAFKALARLRSDVPPSLLAEGLFSRDSSTMEASFEILKQSKSKEVMQAATEMLDSQDYQQRVRAVEVLQVIGRPECAAVLKRLLHDPYPHVRAVVITALEHLEPEDVESMLLAVVRDDDEDDSIRAHAAMSLGRLKGLDYLNALGAAEPSLVYPLEEALELLENEARSAEKRDRTRRQREEHGSKTTR